MKKTGILVRGQAPAGHSIARPLNLDLEKYPDFRERTEPVILPFTIPGLPE